MAQFDVGANSPVVNLQGIIDFDSQNRQRLLQVRLNRVLLGVMAADGSGLRRLIEEARLFLPAFIRPD